MGGSKKKMLCADCTHKDVCRLEGSWDETQITCKYKTELSHNTGHWIKKKGGSDMVEPQERSE